MISHREYARIEFFHRHALARFFQRSGNPGRYDATRQQSRPIDDERMTEGRSYIQSEEVEEGLPFSPRVKRFRISTGIAIAFI